MPSSPRKSRLFKDRTPSPLSDNMASQSTQSTPNSYIRQLFDTPSIIQSEDSPLRTLTSEDSRIRSNVAVAETDSLPLLDYYAGLDWSRVKGSYGPADNGKGMFHSFIWHHGWRIMNIDDNKVCFLCKPCYMTRRPLKIFTVEAGTKGVISHLQNCHSIVRTITEGKKRINDFFEPTPSYLDATITESTDIFRERVANFDRKVSQRRGDFDKAVATLIQRRENLVKSIAKDTEELGNLEKAIATVMYRFENLEKATEREHRDIINACETTIARPVDVYEQAGAASSSRQTEQTGITIQTVLNLSTSHARQQRIDANTASTEIRDGLSGGIIDHNEAMTRTIGIADQEVSIVTGTSNLAPRPQSTRSMARIRGSDIDSSVFGSSTSNLSQVKRSTATNDPESSRQRKRKRVN